MKKSERTREFYLHELEKGKTVPEICQEYNLNKGDTYAELRGYKIKLGSWIEQKGITKSKLFQEYFINKKPLYKIAKDYNVSKRLVSKYFDECGFKQERFKNLIGQKFGKLIVIEYDGFYKKTGNKHPYHYWKCKCECGRVKYYSPSMLHTCKSCGCSRQHYEELINLTYWNTLWRGAAKRDIPYCISMEEAVDIFNKQNGKCFFTGLSIDIPKNITKNQKRVSEFTASLDRLDSNKGYTKDNCVWVHKNVNVMKSSLSPEEFVTICKLVSNKHRNTPEVQINNLYVGDVRRKSKKRKNTKVDRKDYWYN